MKKMVSTRWPKFAIILLLFLTLLADTPGAQAQTPGNQSSQKLSRRLQLLAQPAVAVQNATTQAQTLSLPVAGPGSLLKSSRGELLVYIRLGAVTEANLQALAAAGARIVHVASAYNTVTAYVSTGNLTNLAQVAGVENIREELTPLIAGTGFPKSRIDTSTPAVPHGQAGCPTAITSEGDVQLNAAPARAAFGLDGSGITVGVLSDSFNNSAKVLPTHATADVESGDLPGPGNPCGRVTPVNVLKEGPTQTDEGRAMLQIVHDLAPGADLAFASTFFGQFDFADQIRALHTTAQANVIVDDISYFAEPFFQDGPVSVAIAEVTADGALYFTAAGNSHNQDESGNATGSYEAPAYRPTGCPVGLGLVGDCHDFDPTTLTDNSQNFTVAPGGSMTLDLQWAEPWHGVDTDLNIYLVNESSNILASSADTNPGGTEIPAEFFSYTNNSGSAQTVQLVVNRTGGQNTPRLKYILVRSKDIAAEYTAANSTDTFGPTIFGHGGAAQAISVAALPFDNNDTPESFSSRGFPTYYFEPVAGTAPAAPLALAEVRQKPDVTATNRSRNTFFGTFTAGFNRFFGTSAAAPHAAAVAALMQEQAHRQGSPLNQPATESILETTAAPMAFGFLEASGAGRVDALAAISNLVNSSATLGQITLAMSGPASVGAGNTFAVTVNAQNVPQPGLYGVQFDIHYNPNLIFVDTLQVNPNFEFVVNSSANNEAGSIRLVASRRGNVPGLSGDVTLLTFEATAAADTFETATFTLANKKIGGPNAQPFTVDSQDYAVSIGSAPTATPEPPTATPAPPQEPTPQPTATPTATSQPQTAVVMGQVILPGRAGNNWSGATVALAGSAQSDTTDAAGNFGIINVAPGPYASIAAAAPGYVSATCTGPVVSAPETTLAAVTLLSGDTNGDNVVDITDASTVGLEFGATGPELSPSIDINQDSIIDIFDIILVSTNFGATGPQPWACQ